MEESKRGDNHKERLLNLLQLFEGRTDEDHRLTMRQVLEALAIEDTEHHRRDVRRDIAVLKNAGIDIRRVKHRSYEYFLGKRHFRREETKVLIDIVQSSRSIDEDTSQRLVDTILSLSSPTTTHAIKAGIRLGNRVKTQNSETFRNIEIIQSVLANRPLHKIQFRYFGLDFNMKREYHHDGELIEETPILITYIDDNYYLISYSTVYKDIRTRRIDRMEDVLDTGKKGASNQKIRTFNLDNFEREQFGMFIQKPKRLTLIAKKGAMNALYDHFGDSMRIEPIDDDTARVKVNVSVSRQFIAWVVGMGDLIRIETDIGVDWTELNKTLEVWENTHNNS